MTAWYCQKREGRIKRKGRSISLTTGWYFKKRLEKSKENSGPEVPALRFKKGVI